MEKYSTANSNQFEGVFLVLGTASLNNENASDQKIKSLNTAETDLIEMWTIQANLSEDCESSFASLTDIENTFNDVKIIDIYNPFNNYLSVGCYCVSLLKHTENENEVKDYIENIFEKNNIFIPVIISHSFNTSEII
jgi:hypothetical protein